MAQRTVYVAVPPPPPMPVHVHVTIADAAAEPEPETRRSWQWLIDWARPWHSLTAAVAVLLPIPSYGGYSLTSAWSTVLQDARTDGLTTAYVLAIVATGGAFLLDKARPAWWTRALLIITVIGGTGALGWYDPVTLLTGVHP
ncbi:hypothetical protein [Streptomyces syringium]|uniref:hypothetical protein n=1 Tax=Streptomyces syringium TaxID=76729 RepID=UPI0033D06456